MACVFELIEAGDLRAVEESIASNPDLIDQFGEGNPYFLDKTPLMYALQCLEPGIAEMLIRHGANINAKMRGGQLQPVINFAMSEFVDIGLLKLILSNGADPNQCDYAGENPMQLAVLGILNKDSYCWERLELLEQHDGDWDYVPEVFLQGDVALTPREYVNSLKDHLPKNLIQHVEGK